MNQFPHLSETTIGWYKSEEVSDGCTPESVLKYIVSPEEKEIELVTEEGEWDSTQFYLKRKHIPFLEQLLSDLKEVTK